MTNEVSKRPGSILTPVGDVAKFTPSKMTVPSSLRFSQMTMDDRMRLCVFMAESTTVPKALQGNPANIYYIAERGDRLGLSATESISCVMVVNGHTALWGDMMLALCRASDVWQEDAFDEWFECGGVKVPKTFDSQAVQDNFKKGLQTIAFCQVKRTDAPEPIVRTFSTLDAVLQELDAKPGPWQTAPKRMLQMRARSFALRDAFNDVLFGLYSREEADDIPTYSEASPAQQIAANSQPETKGQAIMQTEAPPLVDPATKAGATPNEEPQPGGEEGAPDETPPQEAASAPGPAIAQLVDASVEQLRKMPKGGATLMKLWTKYKLPTHKFLKEKASALLPEPQLALFGNEVQQAMAALDQEFKLK